jgi:predicted small lipoprotein YifL
MKNSIKSGLAVLVIAISFTACDPASKTPANSTPVDTAKTNAAKIDSTKTLAADSATAVLSDSTKK